MIRALTNQKTITGNQNADTVPGAKPANGILAMGNDFASNLRTPAFAFAA